MAWAAALAGAPSREPHLKHVTPNRSRCRAGTTRRAGQTVQVTVIRSLQRLIGPSYRLIRSASSAATLSCSRALAEDVDRLLDGLPDTFEAWVKNRSTACPGEGFATG